MKATIIASSFGLLAFDEENKLVEKASFPKKPQEAAKTLAELESGKITDGIRELIRHLQQDGFNRFTIENEKLAQSIQEKLGANVEVSKSSAAGQRFRSDIEKFAVETGFVKDAEEFSLWMHDVTMEIAKLRVKGTVEKRDLIVAQAIQTLDDLEKTINMLMIRVREWYGVHFPELDRLMEKHETYARLVLELGSRDEFTVENLRKEDIPEAKAEGIAKTAEKSMGADLTEADIAQIQALSKDVLSLYDLRQGFEGYLDKTMEEVAPNTKALAGALLGARLIAVAGGLTNLARKPASTIQILGAEKALFRSLKTGTRPPKHGMIFQHTLLHDAKRWQRGKIARALAGKLAIGARADAFGGRNISKDLTANLDKRIEEIRQKYAEPPPIPALTEKPRTEGRSFERPRHDEFRRDRQKRRKHRRER
jgi:nucleolar protein 56